jgi:DnaK suppressor protein
MNATVAKNAKKGVTGSAGKKTAGAAAKAGKSGSVSSRTVKSTAKAVADKIAKPKPAKSASGVTKAVAGKPASPAKSAKPEPAAKGATGSKGSKDSSKTVAGVKSGATVKANGKADKELKQAAVRAPAASKTGTRSAPAAKPEAQAVSAPAKGRTHQESTDIKKAAVSKASEVATKTTKSTSAVASDGILSEAQILKMGDKDYMNAAQLAFFKARLQQLEKDLLKNADETTEHLRETVLVPDPADRATIEEEHALELRTRDRERKLLKKVQQSIASIDSGDYGWCEETGEPIGIPRLLARPTATLSLEAQQRRELKQKLYGD